MTAQTSPAQSQTQIHRTAIPAQCARGKPHREEKHKPYVLVASHVTLAKTKLSISLRKLSRMEEGQSNKFLHTAT